MQIKRIYITLLLTLMVLLTCGTGVRAQYAEFKALYIYNFTLRMEWPEKWREGTFNILIANDRALYQQLDKIALIKQVGNQSIKIFTPELHTNEPIHMLYVGHNTTGQHQTIINHAQKSTLIIAETPRVNWADVVFMEDDRDLKFMINESTLKTKGIQVSSSLMRLSIPFKKSARNL